MEREGLIGFTTVKAIVNVATDAEVQSSHARKFSELFAARQAVSRVKLRKYRVQMEREKAPLELHGYC